MVSLIFPRFILDNEDPVPVWLSLSVRIIASSFTFAFCWITATSFFISAELVFSNLTLSLGYFGKSSNGGMCPFTTFIV